jgi:hypothetical protein
MRHIAAGSSLVNADTACANTVAQARSRCFPAEWLVFIADGMAIAL